jgi:hypothetical protein
MKYREQFPRRGVFTRFDLYQANLSSEAFPKESAHLFGNDRRKGQPLENGELIPSPKNRKR